MPRDLVPTAVPPAREDATRALLVLALLLGACATTRGSPGDGPPAGPDPCARSVQADVETARGRLRDGRPDSALLYVEALADCPEAVAFAPYVDLALDVYEEVGRLNEAWNVARLRLDQSVGSGDPAAAAAVAARMERFRSRYVLLEVPQDGRRPPRLAYAGPVADAATRRQLAAVAEERGVWVADGVVGYWLLPGRYEVDGEPRMLEAGATVHAESSR